MIRFRSVWCLVMLAGALCVPHSPVVAGVQYRIVDLGSLGGGESRAFGMNNKGQVVGYITTTDGVRHAFVWDATNGMQDLGTFGYTEGYATDINDDGVIVGYGSTNYVNHGAVTNIFGTPYWQPVPLPGGSVASMWGVNESGQMAGYSGQGTSALHAVVWDSCGHVIHDFGPGGALDVGRNGEVAGYLREVDPYTGYELERAFYWSEDTGLQRLGWGRAYSVNDSGQVVGGPSNFGGPGFVWDLHNGVQYVQAMDKNSELNAINNLGQAVGSYEIDDYTDHAMRWDTENGITDLGALPGYSSSTAWDINDVGVIVGSSWALDGNTLTYRATAWIPVVPEPSGLFVLAGALAGLGVIRRRHA